MDTCGAVTEVTSSSGEALGHGAAVEPSCDANSAIWADMSHDLRTPLNGIIGFSQLLERQHFGSLTERQRSFVEGIQTCGWQLVKLLNNIVDLSKIETGKVSLSREWIALETIVEPVRIATAPVAEKKGITLNAASHPGLPKIFADPERLTQALCCLLSMAVQDAPEGGSVSLTADADEANIYVRVTGVGRQTNAEDLAQLLVGSGSVEAGPGERPDGRTLALALARRLVEMHGGSFDARSASGGARAFRVTIPLNREMESAPPHSPAGSSRSGGA